jgi:hypothetical protein
MKPLRVGLATLYAWRPHVEHLHFLADLTRRAGHETFFLTCDGDLPTCYTREMRERSAWLECLTCRAGGVRSYETDGINSIGELANLPVDGEDAAAPLDWASSSASTLGRFESDADYASADYTALVERLHPAVQRTYRAARAWIDQRQLDAVCIFNGRMDTTRAVFEAARSLDVRVISLERPWFSHGLQLYPDETCMGLRNVHRMVGSWRDRPLRREQALRAASYAAQRFMRRNQNEWRAYNVEARSADWPVAGANRRILLIPSSRNEVWSHPDWAAGWNEPLQAYDALIDHQGWRPEDLLLRCHPNWAETIGKQDGAKSERHYVEWAARRGIRCIAAADTSSTSALIEQSDAIVVANGSAAFEAGMLGKQVIAIAPSIYQEAGFRDAVTSPSDVSSLRLDADRSDAERVAVADQRRRMTLRFAYTINHRLPQYVREVRADSTTKLRYDLSANPARWIDLLRTGELRADDESSAPDAAEEDEVLSRVRAGAWEEILAAVAPPPEAHDRLRRRPVFQWIDTVRPWMKVGDR